jgi:hypothetical protein
MVSHIPRIGNAGNAASLHEMFYFYPKNLSGDARLPRHLQHPRYAGYVTLLRISKILVAFNNILRFSQIKRVLKKK